LRIIWGNLAALTGIGWLLQVEQSWLSRIRQRSLHDLGPRRQLVRFHFARWEDVLDDEAIC